MKAHEEVDSRKPMSLTKLIEVGLNVGKRIHVPFRKRVKRTKIDYNSVGAVGFLDTHGHCIIRTDTRLDESLS